MDSRLNALIAEARRDEIALRSRRPRFHATTHAHAPARRRSQVRRFLRRRLATQE
jgi:hypothetical protein